MKLLFAAFSLFVVQNLFAKDIPDSCYLNDSSTVALKNKEKQLKILNVTDSGVYCEFNGSREKSKDEDPHFSQGKCRVTAKIAENEITIQMDSSLEDCGCDPGGTLAVTAAKKAGSKESVSCSVISF